MIRGSLLAKLVWALLGVLGVTAALTLTLEGRLARRALQEQAAQLLHNDLDALRADLSGQQAGLVTNLRSLGQRLEFGALLAPARRGELVSELAAARRDLALDAVWAIDLSGAVTVGAGVPLRAPPPDEVAALAGTPAAGLLPTGDGGWLLGVTVPVGGRSPAVLAGGWRFDDAAAYRLRGTRRRDVVLQVDGRRAGATGGGAGVGRTIADAVALTGRGRRGAATPGRGSPDPGAAWWGDGVIVVSAADPVAPLERSLRQARSIAVVSLLVVAGMLAALAVRRLTRPLQDLAATADRIAGGDLDAPFATGSSDEVGRLAGSLERMRTEVGRQIEVIRLQRRALEGATRRIVTAQDDERRRLARDLHDGIQQQLVVLRMRAGMARSRRDADALDDDLDGLAADIDGILERLRETAQGIFPSILADRGLTGALHGLAARSPLPIVVRCDPDPLPRIDAALETGAYFIVSEALTNVLKHAQAGSVEVTAEVCDGHLAVAVRDDGRGFDAAEVRPRGLEHLRDRALALGGELDVASSPAGTELSARLPLGGRGAGAPPSVVRALQVEQDRRDAPV